VLNTIGSVRFVLFDTAPETGKIWSTLGLLQSPQINFAIAQAFGAELIQVKLHCHCRYQGWFPPWAWPNCQRAAARYCNSIAIPGSDM